MISTYVKPNKFGRSTWLIKIGSLFQLEIHEMSSNKYMLELKERGFISYKCIHSAYIEGTVRDAIIRSFDEVFRYFGKSNDTTWTEAQASAKLAEALEEYDRNYANDRK